MKSVPPARAETHWALDPEQLLLVKLFAVVHEPLTADDVLGYLQRSVVFGWKPLPSRKHVRDLLDQLVSQQKLVQLDPNGTRLRIHPRMQHQVLALLQAEGELMDLAGEVQRFTPLRVSYPTYTPRIARELLYALYLEASPKLDPLLERLLGPYRSPQQVQTTVFDALGRAPSAEVLRKLGPALAESYHEVLWPSLIAHLQPVPDGPVEHVREQGAQLSAIAVSQCAFALATQDLYEHALRVLEGRSEPEAEAARAFVALCRHEVEEARELAAVAIEQSRDRRGTVRGVRGLLGPWVALLLLSQREPHLRALASQQVARAERDVAMRGFEQEYASLKALQVFLDGGQVYLPSHSFDFSEWQACLFTVLLTRWVGEELPKGLRSELAVIAHMADLRGAPWVARVVKSLTPGAPDAEVLLTLYTPEAPWERALAALSRAVGELDGPSEAAPKEPKEERVVFVLKPEDEGFALTARVQTRKGKGFSAGRAVPWKKLLETPRESPLFDEHDLRVLPHIVLDREGGYGLGSYLPEPDAALALVGHPRVFASDDAKEPVEVLRGTVRIDVAEQGGELSVSIHPAQCSSPRRGVFVERDNPAQLVVYALSDAQRKVAARLGRAGLRVPESGRGRVEELVGKLAAHFPVASDVGVDASELPEVACETRLHVHLWRRGFGLAARIMVVPLGTGPSFAPGEGTKSVLGTRSGEHGPERVRTTRDLAAESAQKEALLARAPTLAKAESQGRDLVVQDVVSCLEVLTELHRLREELVLTWPEGTPLSIAAEADTKSLSLTLKSEGEWLAADGEVVIDDTLKLSLAVLLEKTANAEGRFIALDEQRFIALSDTLKRRLDAMRALAEKRDEGVQLHPLAAIELASWTHELSDFKGDSRIALRLARLKEAAELMPEVPAQLEADLRLYQRDGFTWLARLAHWGGGACLADDMGLGKTLQTLALLLREAPSGPTLVISPLSVCSNWIDEARKFAPTLRARMLRASDRDAALAELGPFDVVVTSYGFMQQEIDRLEKVHFRTVILDEAQAIKNAGTLRTKAALRLVGDVRVALTGTPVENHLGELWSIMTFLNPGLLGSAKGFEERFVKPIQRDQDPQAKALLRRIVRPFVLRRRKSEVLDDLPEKTIVTQRIPPSPEERALYQTLREGALKKLTDRSKPAETRMRLLAELMRMRRAACHPDLVVKDAGLESSKLKVFESLLLELREEGHRALVFSQFVDYLSIVRARLDVLGISYQYLDGSTSQAQRDRAVKAFQAGEGDAFLISLKAGGFGLNLTAADYVFHLDPWWNPAVEDQASDRAHRMGQTRPVTIYRLVMEGSIEEKILSLHAHKRDLADQLLEGSSQGGTLDVDELMALLHDSR
jgi:hypothetical protein